MEPFPLLRGSLKLWIDGLPDSDLKLWAKDVLLCMQVDLWCDSACSVRSPVGVDAHDFVPQPFSAPLLLPCPAEGLHGVGSASHLKAWPDF